MKQRLIFSLIGVLLLGAIIWIFWPTKKTLAPTTTNNTAENVNVTLNINVPAATDANLIGFSTADLPERDPAFEFTALIPSTWRVEYVPGSQAINVYDPKSAGAASLDQSKIFITHFTAQSFQTLSSVTIKSQSATTINNRPAMLYTIEKKSGLADFMSQPSWRNSEHQVTDIRVTDTNPGVYYVIAKSPSVTDGQYSAFLSSMTFSTGQ